MEEWRDIEGFEGIYQVSSWGRVRSKYGILTPYRNKKGYLKIGLYIGDRKTKKYRINRLVAAAFIPNPLNLPQVNHKDGNKENNSVTNLEWSSDRQNKDHAKRMRRGELWTGK